ncbi:MAG: hypothetical protein ACPGVA_04700 [Pikeienuella sp.]
MENFGSIFVNAVQFGTHFFEIGFAIIAAASAIAALTPTPADDHFLGRAYKILEVLALNFGHAKDKASRSKGGRFVSE